MILLRILIIDQCIKVKLKAKRFLWQTKEVGLNLEQKINKKLNRALKLLRILYKAVLWHQEALVETIVQQWTLLNWAKTQRMFCPQLKN